MRGRPGGGGSNASRDARRCRDWGEMKLGCVDGSTHLPLYRPPNIMMLSCARDTLGGRARERGRPNASPVATVRSALPHAWPGAGACLVGKQRCGVTPPRRWDITHEVGQLPLHGVGGHGQVVRLVDNAGLVVLRHAAAAKDDRLLADHLPTRGPSTGQFTKG